MNDFYTYYENKKDNSKLKNNLNESLLINSKYHKINDY